MSLAPTAPAFGEIAARLTSACVNKPSRSGALHRTGQPVRRGSKERGTFEDQFWVPPQKGDTDDQYAAVAAAADEGRKLRSKQRSGEALTSSERRKAAIFPAAVRIFEVLTDLARVNAGRVYPSDEHIWTETGYSDDTIARSLDALEALGALQRQRRFVKVPGKGPTSQYRQTSSAYRTLLPKMLVSLLRRLKRRPPVSADLTHHHAQQTVEADRMLRSASCVEQVTYIVSASSDFRSDLLRLGAAIDQRDSDELREPLPILI